MELLKRLMTIAAVYFAAAIVCSESIRAQQRLSGTVIDASTGEPLAFVNVHLKGTHLGTITAINGTYALLIPDRAGVVVSFSYVGYEGQSFLLIHSSRFPPSRSFLQ